MEFSKKILYFAAFIGILTLIAGFVLMWRTGDLSALPTVLVSVSSPITAGVTFYYWKAKPEARLKILLQARREGIKLPLDDIDQELYLKSEEET